MQSANSKALLKLEEFPKFTRFSSLKRHQYEEFIRQFDPYSDYGYTSLYVWGRNKDQGIALLNGNIVLSMQDYMSEKKMLSFLGTRQVNETADTLLNFASAQEEYMGGLHLIPEITASKISADEFKVTADRDNHDYLLDTHRFIDLDGSEFAHTRRKLSQFTRRHGKDISTKQVDLRKSEIKDAINNLSHEWAFMGTEGSVSAHEELTAIDRLLSDFDTLNTQDNIRCLAMVAGDRIEGFCIYEVHDPFATVHFIKSNLEKSGSADFMMVETMRHIAKIHGINTVNHEQDLGIAGLRRAKEHYRPIGFLKKYSVTNI